MEELKMMIFSCTFLALICSAVSVSVRQGEGESSLKFVLSPDGVEPILNATKAQSVTIHCGHPNDWFNVTGTVWRKNGVEMKVDEEHHIIFHNKNLHFAKLKLSDSGRYECELTTDVDGKIRKTVRRGFVEVSRSIGNAVPVVRMDSGEDSETDCESPESVARRSDPNCSYLCFVSSKMSRLMAKPAGTTVLLPCRVQGNPKPSVTWYFKDRPVNLANNYQIKSKPNGLQISDVAPKDAGMYRCEATNGNITESYDIDFHVVRKYSDKPYIRNLDNSTILLHGTVRLHCDVQEVSDKLMLVSWKKIVGSIKSPVESRTSNESLRANSHYLILENVTKEDEGEYMCLAGNAIGTSTKSAWVTVLTEFPSPEVSNVRDAPHQANYAQYLFVLALPMCAVVLLLGGLKYRLMQNHAKKHTKHHHYSTVKKVLIEKKRFESNDEKAVLVPEINIKNVVSMFTDQEYEFPLDVTWEFPRDRLEIGKHLGEGAFGEVKLGIANGITETGILSKVAVKSLKKIHNDAEMIDLISEMETMKELGQHKNIINLLGCCTQGGELLVIMEFAENGNLRDYLRANRHHFTYERPRTNIHGCIMPIDVNNPLKQSDMSKQEQLSFADLMSMAYQVARGMDYLVQRKYVHRDLAARNVLVCANKVVKIADFGMTRSTFTNDYYRKKSDGRVPVKWMAPETLFHKIYTTQSDVWSYGILLWEIATLGGTPYPSMPDVTNLLEYLKSGRRMEQPCNCPTELYLIMRDCWMESPTSRPSFSDLVEDIRRILYIASGADYMDLEGLQPFEYGVIETPPSSPEHSGDGMPFFDPEFVKSFSQS